MVFQEAVIFPNKNITAENLVFKPQPPRILQSSVTKREIACETILTN